MAAYYNEIDSYAAQWLRNLIAAGHIAPGDVDERSIEDVKPDDLRGYSQCHFFAGIGGWSIALRYAGWADDRRVWTGSCPCQPFSAAGKGAGFADERHLWPAWQHLIAQCQPPVIFGEQVASKAAESWIDLVHADLEGMGYAFGCVPFPSAGVGAPHIRDRNYWVADAKLDDCRRETSPTDHFGPESDRPADRIGRHSGASVRLADANGRNPSTERQQRGGEQRQQPQDGDAGGLVWGRGPSPYHRTLGTGDLSGYDWLAFTSAGILCGDATGTCVAELRGIEVHAPIEQLQRPGPTAGFWRNADWLGCTDGKFRPVEPGTFPLAHGISGRVGLVCAPCLKASAQNSNDENVRALREFFGTDEGRLAAQVLRPSVHGRSLHESPDDSGGREVPSAKPVPGNGVRGLRENRPVPSSSSQGPKSYEQRPGEHSDPLRGVSLGGAQEDACSCCGKESDWMTESSIQSNRAGRLRAYGNAINPHQAAEFIRALR